MSTNGLVAIPTPDGGLIGRYVHSDGYPSWLGWHLRNMVNRDGLPKVIQTLIHDHAGGWSYVDPERTELFSHQTAGYVLVPGYGIAYVDDRPEAHEPVTSLEESGAQWAYILTRDGIVVKELRYNGHSPRRLSQWIDRGDMDLSLSREAIDELTYARTAG